MSGCDDDEEIAGKCPSNGAECGNKRTLFQGAHKDVESKEIEEHKTQRTSGEQGDDAADPSQEGGRTIGGRNLIVGHSREDAVAPPTFFASGIEHRGLFAALPHASHGVVTTKHEVLFERSEEISPTQEHEA